MVLLLICNCLLIDNKCRQHVMELERTSQCLKFRVKGLKAVFDTFLTRLAAWVGWCIMCVQVCWHLLSRPDNADSGSRISWRQTAHSASPLVSGSVFWDPTCCLLASVDACLPRFPTGDGRAITPNTKTGPDPPGRSPEQRKLI